MVRLVVGGKSSVDPTRVVPSSNGNDRVGTKASRVSSARRRRIRFLTTICLAATFCLTVSTLLLPSVVRLSLDLHSSTRPRQRNHVTTIRFEIPPVTSRRSFPRIWMPGYAVEQARGNLRAAAQETGALVDDGPTREYELPENITISTEPSIRSHDLKCTPLAEWHKLSFPTCNNVHEIDVQWGVRSLGHSETADASGGVTMKHLSEGGTRQAWILERTLSLEGAADVESGGESARRYVDPPLIFKNLRYRVNYTETMFEHQRKDALAMERLTSSPYVIDVYGFCGETAINTLANGGDLLSHVEKREEKEDPLSPRERLVHARDLARGLAAIHGIDGWGSNATLVHHDIKPRNFLLMDGKVQFHDFNNAQLAAEPKEEAFAHLCRFSFRDSCRSRIAREIEPPEECSALTDFTEKYEVFRLGLVFYFLLTGSIAGRMFQSSDPKEHVVLSNPPSLPDDIASSGDKATRALVNTMHWALSNATDTRPTAFALAESLADAVVEIEVVSK